jgi:hypothetical protein
MRRLTCAATACAAAGLLLLACGGEAPTNTAANANAADSANSMAADAGAAGESGGGKIGVPECDDFIAKYEACVDSEVPAAMRAAVKSSLDSSRAAWRNAAVTAEGRADLARTCKAAHEEARKSLSAYDCSW